MKTKEENCDMEEKERITFKELSLPLKIGIIYAWIIGLLYTSFVIIGFIEGFLYG